MTLSSSALMHLNCVFKVSILRLHTQHSCLTHLLHKLLDNVEPILLVGDPAEAFLLQCHAFLQVL